jgi:tripartite ATP-independent transporter DctM subunit
MTVSELVGRGYDRNLVMGSLAGAGTLGFLIPPSVIMIIYGVLAEVSIIRLFIAGIIPGLMLAFAYMAYLGVVALVWPQVVPATERHFTWGERLRGLVDLGPVLFLMVAIIGSMYAGIASPTEAAAVGVLGALIVAAAQSSLTWPNLRNALMSALRTSSMVGLIIMGAFFMSVSMGYLGIPRSIATAIGALKLGPYELILMLVLLYAVLGCVLEGLSMIVMTLPITLPLVTAAGFDPIWFGVFMVLVVEMAQVTPPVGFNLFVIQGMTGAPLGVIARAAAPFFLIMALFTGFITIFPEIVTWLPNRVMARG